MTIRGLNDRREDADTSGECAGNRAGAADLLAQSLARGAAGTALLHIERACSGTGPWQTAHAWVKTATSGPIIASEQAGLFYGAPAISFILHAAQADGNIRYRAAARTVDEYVTRLAERRLLAAESRISRDEDATFAEYDLFYGLTGIGALLLCHTPGSALLPRILSYLVRLTETRPDERPGWWVNHDPDPALPTSGGHANLGMAHGGSGILAFISSAARRGIIVDRHLDAIARLSEWFDRWRQDGPAGHWWPQWITRDELTAGWPARPGPPRPSWCYGTAGVARSLQLAAIALGDATRQHIAEQALADCLTDPGQVQRITGPGLCHGIAGVYQTAWRSARDALTPSIGQQLPALSTTLRQHAGTAGPASLLDGNAGLALALETAASPGAPPHTGWDACLLID